MQFIANQDIHTSSMKLNIAAKGFDLHEAQKFIIDRGMAKLNRFLKNTPQDLIDSNVMISCHHNPTPSFTSHLYLELPDQKISAIASSHKFNLAFTQSLNKLMQQLRKRKTRLMNYQPSQNSLKSA